MMLALIQKVAVASFIAALICGFFPSALQATIIDSGGGQFVWTELVTFSSPCQPSAVCQVGSIPGSPGSLIEIVNIAIGGDADATSGDAVFRLVGGGLDFTWTSGQSGTIATYDLGATPPTGPGSDRGFTYSGPISFFATEGTSLNIFFVAHFDFDGRFTNATDILGNVFNDSAVTSSVRPWIQFQVSAVPEPSTIFLVGAGLLCFPIISRMFRR